MVRSVAEIQSIVRTASREICRADGATFVLREDGNCYYADEDAIEPLWKGKRFPMEACISGWSMLNRQSVIIEDIYQDPRIPVDAYRPTFVKSLLMMPIRSDNPIGAIGAYWARRHAPDPREVEMLQALADTTSVAFENIELFSTLDRRVVQRTAELELANRELESFMYSVSHDLRAPLRAIGGFSSILAQDYGAALDEKARRLLDDVVSETSRMNELINALLDLSRLAKAKLHFTRVDLSAIAREICERERGAIPANTEIGVASGMNVCGDARLIRALLENLIMNAFKFSGKVSTPSVEIGCSPPGSEEQIFFVKDNGAGFDPKYAGKLFAPFQRLHSEEEFPGTGIGLATVRRIASRHGGRVWAESKPGEGATFYFALPLQQG